MLTCLSVRFVKIMPLLNLHQEGVEQLVEYLSSEVRRRKREKNDNSSCVSPSTD